MLSQSSDSLYAVIDKKVKLATNDSVRIQAKLELTSNLLHTDSEAFEKEITEIERDLERSSGFDASALKVKVLQQQGIALRKKAQYNEAISRFLEAITIIEKSALDLDPLAPHFYIAVVFYELKEYDKAISYYKKGIEQRGEKPPDAFLADAFNNIGLSYRNKKELDSALFYYQKASALYERFDNEQGYYKLLNNIGSIHTKKKEYGKAIAMKLPSLAYYKKQNRFEALAILHNSIGTNYGRLKKYEKAIDHLDTVIALSRKQNLTERLKRAYKRRSQLYNNQGDYKSAFADQEMYYRLIDSINTIEKSTKIELLIRANDAEKKQLLADAAFEKQRVKNTRNYISVLSGLLFLVIGFFYYKKQAAYTRLKNKVLAQEVSSQQQTIQDKEGVITNLMRENIDQLRKKDKLLGKIENLAEANKDQSDAKEMLLSLKAHKFDEKKVLLFHEKLYRDHKDFKEKLTRYHPNFTKAEGDMAHYVMLKMSLKEIANLRGVTLDSVKKSRYRLRKKIGLVKDKSLLSYFSSL